MRSATTRRELIGGAIGGSAGAALLTASSAAAAAAAPTEAELLRDLLASELLAVYCYQHILSAGLLSPRATRVATRALSQERAHAAALRAALVAKGGTPPPAPASVAEADRELSTRLVSNRLGHLRDHEDARRLLIALEGVLEGSYYLAIGLLSDPKTIRMAAEMLANEGQHEVLLRLLAHEHEQGKALPSALVQGTLPKRLAGSLG
jgi:hypothetical protein